MATKREPELSKLWRHRPGRELVGKVEDVFIAKWHSEYRPIVLNYSKTSNGCWMMAMEYMREVAPGMVALVESLFEANLK